MEYQKGDYVVITSHGNDAYVGQVCQIADIDTSVGIGYTIYILYPLSPGFAYSRLSDSSFRTAKAAEVAKYRKAGLT